MRTPAPLRWLLPCLLLGALRAEVPPRADVVIYGATPGGIVTAVRAAREGLMVVLVHHHRHVGGMMSNGLGLFDTIYAGRRAPLYDEVHARIMGHYRDQRQPDGTPHRGYEPHVAESVFETMLAAERNVTVVREFHPVHAVQPGRLIETVTFRRMDGTDTLTLAAGAFVDASYEGDLAHVAGVRMTAGREGRDHYGEAHAGRVFTKLQPTPNPSSLRRDGMNVRVFPVMANELLPGSTGEGDRAIQAYNFRVCLTRDPANRTPVEKTERYERDLFLAMKDRWRFTSRLPGQKTSWNAPLLVGGNFDYPGGDWPTRRAIAARHRDFALGLLWFMQHDEVVPEAIRAEAREWGLPRDEFQDNAGFPWEMYVREARRLVGRQVFTQHDGQVASGLRRTPVHADSIAITEWPMDSHSCTPDTVPGSDHEGKVILTEETRPGQIPYRCLLPGETDNLLVTGCLSSSHIGWGTIRLEPVWMHVGESAAHALALAKREQLPPAGVPVEKLRRVLVDGGVMVSFFNDFDMARPTVAQRAAQYFGTLGYFGGYDARLGEPLSPALARVWARPDADAMATARRAAMAETAPGTLTAREFARLAGRDWPDGPAGALTRGAALTWLWDQLEVAALRVDGLR